MKELFYLILVLLPTSQILEASLRSEVRKCCTSEEVLQDLGGDLSCVEMPSLSVEINNLSSDAWGLSDCRSSKAFFFMSLEKIRRENLHVSHSACLDNLYNNYTGNNLPIVVYCDYDAGDLADYENALETPHVLSVKKCCPHGQYFNVDEKSCVFTEDKMDLKSFLNISDEVNLLTLGVGSPVCEDALVNYVTNITDVNKNNGKIMVKAPWKNGFIDLTKPSDVENICIDFDTSRNVLLSQVCVNREHCKNNPCLRKCCPEGEAYVSKINCLKYPQNETENPFHAAVKNVTNTKNFKLDTNGYGLLVGKICKYNMYALNMDEEWSFTDKGYVYVHDEQRIRDHDYYCMEMFYNITDYEDGIYPLICFDPPHFETDTSVLMLDGVLQSISCICLLITLLVYICIPELQNLHGKTLMCHVGSLFIAYMCLAMITFDISKSNDLTENEKPENKLMCATLGYVLLFAFNSAFSWLNVMCFDIWWTFGNTRTPSGVVRNRKQRNRFIAYGCYSWGTALAITSLCILMDSTEILSITKRPNIGRDRCWFQHGLGATELVFFTGPVTLQLSVNLLFFILTSMNYNKVKTQIRRVLADPTDQRNRRFQGDREKLIMNVKLFVVMGISWICEVISNYMNFFAPELLKYKFFVAFDVINCLQGAFIFALFVLKRKVYEALRRRLLLKDDQASASNVLSLRDPYRVKKSSSNSTVMSTFNVSSPPAVIPDK